MIIYLAEGSGQHFEVGDKTPLSMRLLASYHYYRTWDFDKKIDQYFQKTRPVIFADSGAFSATSQGAVIDIDDYARWLKRWQHVFEVYANLDIIGDAVATQRNQDYLEKEHGLSPLPVFHIGSDFSHLERLAEQYDYIALGGLVPHLRYTKRVMTWLLKCFKVANGRARFHGFGCTNWTILMSLPWRSVDSTSWTSGFRYGDLMLFIPDKGRWTEIKIGNKAHALKHRHTLLQMGIMPEQLYDREKNTRQINAYVAAVSFQLAEQFISRRFDPDFSIYLAEAAASLPNTPGSIQ